MTVPRAGFRSYKPIPTLRGRPGGPRSEPRSDPEPPRKPARTRMPSWSSFLWRMGRRSVGHRQFNKRGAWLVFGAAVVGLVIVGAGAVAAENLETTAARLITAAADQSAEKGLTFLAARQHDDGTLGTGSYRGNVAVVSLAGMAWMAQGSTPGRGRFGREVARALDYVLAHAQESGFITNPTFAHHGPMYGHGFATLFLAECYGMSPRTELRDRLAKAVQLIVACQNEQGGWRYYPQRMDADISVTVCQMMALRAARNAGIFVPRQTIERAAEYVKKSQNADGGFMYMLSQGGESDFPRSAAALVGLYSAGVYEGPEVTKAIPYLMSFVPQRGVVRRERYFYYGHYYAAIAMWQAGSPHWERWYPAVRDELITRQRPDGSWIDPISNECATAMACMVLQIPNNYLPIFQR